MKKTATIAPSATLGKKRALARALLVKPRRSKLLKENNLSVSASCRALRIASDVHEHLATSATFPQLFQKKFGLSRRHARSSIRSWPPEGSGRRLRPSRGISSGGGVALAGALLTPNRGARL
jgi:hypothetical protein